MNGKDIEIKITGMRPREKLSEVLHFDTEKDEHPFHPLISRTTVSEISPEVLKTEHDFVTAKDQVLYQ